MASRDDGDGHWLYIYYMSLVMMIIMVVNVMMAMIMKIVNFLNLHLFFHHHRLGRIGQAIQIRNAPGFGLG